MKAVKPILSRTPSVLTLNGLESFIPSPVQSFGYAWHLSMSEATDAALRERIRWDGTCNRVSWNTKIDQMADHGPH